MRVGVKRPPALAENPFYVSLHQTYMLGHLKLLTDSGDLLQPSEMSRLFFVSLCAQKEAFSGFHTPHIINILGGGGLAFLFYIYFILVSSA